MSIRKLYLFSFFICYGKNERNGRERGRERETERERERGRERDRLHAVEADCPANVPAEQLRHAVAPTVAEKRPAGQTAHHG